MTRFLSLFALLFLFSASEASACWPWCSRILASVTAPLTDEFDLVLPDPGEEELSTVKDATRRDVRSDFNIDPRDAKDLFNGAYGGLEFSISRKNTYRRWLWTIEQPTRDEWGMTSYEQHWGFNSVLLEREKGQGVLDFSFNFDPEAALSEGQYLGLVNSADTPAGAVARAILAHGGAANFHEISYEFDIRRQQDRSFYQGFVVDNRVTVPSRTLVLYQAEQSLPGKILRTLVGFTADRFEVIADNNRRSSRVSKYKVWISPVRQVYDSNAPLLLNQPIFLNAEQQGKARRKALKNWRSEQNEQKDMDE